MEFRILGIKILNGCKDYVHKILSVNETYLLCDDMQVCPDDENMLVPAGKRSDVAKTLYDVKCENGRTINVNVSGIVGKNGDGKSSFVEIILRLLNNFAFAYGFKKDHDTLAYNESVAGILYYQVGDDIYALRCEGGDIMPDKDGKLSISWYRNGSIIEDIDISDKNVAKKKALIDNHLQGLFYTLVINYSIYSYNSLTFARESKSPGSWIESLFHKNDSYQTPLVLVPMRDAGNIDINNEEMLAFQRLMSLYTQAGDNVNERKISKNEEAVGFAFYPRKSSPFVTKTISEYFGWHHYDDINWHDNDIYFVPVVHGTKDKHKIEKNNISMHFIRFWEEYVELAKRNKGLISLAAEILNNPEMSRSGESDMMKYVGKIDAYLSMSNYAPYFQCNDSINNFLNGELKWMNFTQFYRLVQVMVLWDMLKELCPEIDCDLDEALANYENSPLYAAKLYVGYKVLEITIKYSPYYEHSYNEDTSFQLFCNPISRNIGFSRMKSDIKEILEKEDYTTLKLRQACNYIKNYTAENELLGAKPIEEVLPEYKPSQKKSYYYVSFQNLHKLLTSYEDYKALNSLMALLPPPIFRGDIIISRDGQYHDRELLSSGEKQRLNTVGSFVYHLRNIDSKLNDADKVQYENVFVIFEEIELYFHPEYQKSFVSFLLNQIKMANFDNIKSINILFVTHSPFVLSDMVRSNVLYLEKGGIVHRTDIETFGANLYDLTYDGFFLKDNALGDFSGKYIGSLIERVNEGNQDVTDEELELVGDSLMKRYIDNRR